MIIRPTADHYARALLISAGLMGERERLVQLALDHTEPDLLRRRPLKCRPVAYAALRRRFPAALALDIARTLGMSTASPRGARKYGELSRLVADRL